MDSRPEFMTWNQLRELVSEGHSVQSHGWSHRVLEECSDHQLREELERSKQTIEDRLATPVDAISIPHGRWDSRVLESCAAAGYKRVYISDPWMQPHSRHGLAIAGRYMVRRSMRADQLRRLLNHDPAYIAFLRSRYRVKENLRRVLGEAAYHRLWCLLAASKKLPNPLAYNEHPSSD
jgi:peptidoglycan/xylan/chitin deacetylase (PgdA/CDA1 family)